MPETSEETLPFEVVRKEAWYWWRTNHVVGVILHRLMLLFIFVPLVLVYYRYYVYSFFVFAGMVPYGLFLQYLAERSIVEIIRRNPETIGRFEEEGVIVR